MPENQEPKTDQKYRRLFDLQAKAHVRERPFASDKPLIGRFIVFIRERWNSVAARWYVRPMLHQQNIFNQAVAQAIKELYEQPYELEERVIGNDRDLTLLARKVAEMEYRLKQGQGQATKERVELSDRLSRLEAMLEKMSQRDLG